jgi:hypothetical protein
MMGCAVLSAATLEEEAAGFLDRWLVRGEVEKALQYMSRKGPLCVPPPNTAKSELGPTTPRDARERLRSAMTTVLRAVGRHSTLGSVIAIPPPNIGPIGRPGTGGLPFIVWDAPAENMQAMTCGIATKQKRGVVVFVFRSSVESEPAGGMYLVFEQQGLSWRIIGFDALRQYRLYGVTTPNQQVCGNRLETRRSRINRLPAPITFPN